MSQSCQINKHPYRQLARAHPSAQREQHPDKIFDNNMKKGQLNGLNRGPLKCVLSYVNRPQMDLASPEAIRISPKQRRIGPADLKQNEADSSGIQRPCVEGQSVENFCFTCAVRLSFKDGSKSLTQARDKLVK